MKKAILLILALVLVLSLAACGGKDTGSTGSSSTTPPASNNGNGNSETTQSDNTPSGTPDSTPSKADTTNDMGTVADFLSVYDLSETDIKPELFIEFEELKMDGSTKAGESGSSGFISIVVDKDATGEEQVKAWFEKIYDKMQKLSSDGKIYKNYTSMDEEFTLETLFENPLWEKFPGTMWAYKYKMPDRDVKIIISTSYDYETGIYKMSIMVMG
jgi:predicted small secreted protein